MGNENMSDQELDLLLEAAGQPVLPKDFADRLQARLDLPAVGNVIAFPLAKKKEMARNRIWLSAIPLAASLALGLYLGAAGTVSDSLLPIGTSLTADASDPLPDIGIEDTESFLNGELS